MPLLNSVIYPTVSLSLPLSFTQRVNDSKNDSKLSVIGTVIFSFNDSRFLLNFKTLTVIETVIVIFIVIVQGSLSLCYCLPLGAMTHDTFKNDA